MKKNKKILLIIITAIISAMLFTSKLEAKTIMLLNCQYVEQCTDAYCNITSFIRYTNKKGNIDWVGIYAAGQHDSIFDLIESYKKEKKIVLIGYKDLEKDDYCWINDYSNIDENCKENRSIGWKGKNTYFDFLAAGICPSGLRKDKYVFDDEIVPAGKDGVLTPDTLYLEEPKYIIYKYTDTKGNERQVAEGYNKDGKYCVIGPDITIHHYDEIMYHQFNILKNSINKDKKVSFFDVDTNFNNLIISNRGADTSGGDKMPKCEDEKDCHDNHGYDIIIDSNDSTGRIKDGVKEWLSTNNEKFKAFEKIASVVSDETFISEIETLNDNAESGKIYNFKKISKENMISKIEEAYDGLEKAYVEGEDFVDCATGQKTSAVSSFVSCKIYQENLGINQISDLIKDSSNKDTEHMINQNYIVEMIVNQVNDEMEKQISSNDLKVNLLDASRDLKKYTALFYYAVSYMDSNPDAYFLNTDQKERVNILLGKFEELVKKERLDIYPVTSCEGLLGEGLINKINSYLNIIKIAVPIILIGFGTIEFTKAIFSENEDNMKKAQKQFIKRLAIAMLIFFVPIILNLLLTLANKVWPIIIPNTCGIG